MKVSESPFNIKAIQASWQKFDAATQLRPTRTEADYKHMVQLMEILLNVAGDDEDHPLSGLLELVSDLVWKYEQENFAIEAATPQEMLRFLMEARQLKQEDLAEIVAQGNLSAILSGKRKISATLAGKLGHFFKISPAAFIPS
jgi:HTH-type transcriptional regulator/antitoxin HigA